MSKFDFSGWATKNNLRCSDGRTIMPDAFKECDGMEVPLVWNHQHNDSFNVLGHALLENRKEGVYAYCTFNETESGQNAKLLVKHGDVRALSIYANKLKQNGGNVLHGTIREVSLVLAGANPGAIIESVLSHGDKSEEDATILFFNEPIDKEETEMRHAEEPEPVEEEISHAEEPAPAKEETKPEEEKKEMAEKTVKDVFNTLTEEQKTVVYALIGEAMKNKGSEEEDMKHNVFDGADEYNGADVISHSEIQAALADGKRLGSMKEAFLQHGIEDIEYLFPDAKTLGDKPEFIKRPDEWVGEVMGAVHHTPFSRIKSVFADITEDEARAKGYIKGKLKKEEVFSLLKRTTTPTTIYKKQKLDRDDVIDITDFDVIAWIKGEMRMMLDEEIARAILVGDGRLTSDDDHINHSNIRPIWTDAPLYTVNATVTEQANSDETVKAMIKTLIKSRKSYKGSGNPVLYCTEDFLTDALLLTDTTGRDLYDSVEKLQTKLRVKKIVTVPVMEGLTRTDADDSKVHTLHAILVNLKDYNVGADKGGAVNMFDDFDIDYNAMKYLIETRCSGALIKPYSAIALETVAA